MPPHNQTIPGQNPLELDGRAFAELTQRALARLTTFLDTLPEQPASWTEKATEIAGAQNEPLPTAGESVETLFDRLFRDVFPLGFNTAGPGYLAYIPGGGLPHAAVADLISYTVNRYVGLWTAAPAAAEIEATVVRWLTEIVGYGEAAGGFLTSGGSLANWSGIVLARDTISPDQVDAAVVYTSQQSHHSVSKAATLVGIRRHHVRMIATDGDFRVSIDEIREQISRDRRAGLQPLAIVANAGTTNTGAVDDLEAVADLAQNEKLWLHVDAAYGGFFMLTERGQTLMKGIARADSVALDPHKGLFLPYGTGGLVVRDREHLRRTFAGRGEYMTAKADDRFVDFCDVSPELTRDFRGLRIWLPLKMHGVTPFRDCLDEKLDLARHAAAELRKVPGIRVDPEPQLSIVPFRLDLPELELAASTQINRELLELVNASRRVYLSGTELAGRFTLRLCILSFRTHLDRIDECLDLIRRSVDELSRRIRPV